MGVVITMLGLFGLPLLHEDVKSITVCAVQAILRLCSLRHFGYFVAKLKGVNFTFNASTGQFIGPQQPVQSASTSTAPTTVVGYAL